VPAYVAAQLVGAVLGGLLIVGIFGARAATGADVGATTLSDGTGYVRGIVAEVIGTFLLVFTIMALAVDQRAPAGWAGLIIGLSVTTDILLIGSVTGGSMNPARTFGPYLTNTLFGGSTPWSQFIVYVIGPLAGGVLAAVAYIAIARPSGKWPPGWRRARRAKSEAAGSARAVRPEGVTPARKQTGQSRARSGMERNDAR
jgi:glycerol uptake facilitator protein